METYYGHVRTPADAIILFEACRIGLLPRVQRRLSEKERQSIRSGSVFVWDEKEAGMRRWTDGKSWSASRVSGSFLTYREMEGKRGGAAHVAQAASRPGKTPESNRGSDDDPGDGGDDGPDGYRYKPDGLMKQSFSITTSAGQHLHLISYYARSHPTAPGLNQPSSDPNLRHIRPQKGLYPESSINDQQNLPVVTRAPMVGAPYSVPPASVAAYSRPGVAPAHSYAPAYAWGTGALPGHAQQVPVVSYVPNYLPAPVAVAEGGHPPAVAYGHPAHMQQPPPPPPPPPPPHHQHAYDRYPHHVEATTAVPPHPAAHSGASHPPSLPAYASRTSLPNGGGVQPAHAPGPPPAAQPGQAQATDSHTAPSQPDTHTQQQSHHLATQPEHVGSRPSAQLTPPHPSSRHPPPAHPPPLSSPRDSHPEGGSSTATVIPGIRSFSPVPPPFSSAAGAAPLPSSLQESSASRSTEHQRNVPGVNGETAAAAAAGIGDNTQSVGAEGPKDIPSEKFGFGEDVRALRQLDRVFSA